MNKLSAKFTACIISILLSATLLILFINACFTGRYYIFQKKSEINRLCKKLENGLENDTPDNVISKMEQTEKVVIVKLKTDKQADELSGEIREAFYKKGIGFQKYWLWEQDYKDIVADGHKIRIYKQDKLNYSIMTEYTKIGPQLYAIAMIVPDISDAFGIISTFLIAVQIITVIFAILFIIILVKRITRPLEKFRLFALNMKQHQYFPLEIHTQDELEIAAESLNSMGLEIKRFEQSLQEKTHQMEQLLSDVAHDLKTPVSLIKLYTDGIKDGMDDGTFLDTISLQNEQIENMINRLLLLSRIENAEVTIQDFDLAALLIRILDEYQMLASDNDICFCTNIQTPAVITSNLDWTKTMLSNLITNAMKYSCSGHVWITLHRTGEITSLSITNETLNKNLDITKIWDPYYVAEQSRNKNLSGTGLGLSIVKKIAARLHYQVSCEQNGKEITFTLTIRN